MEDGNVFNTIITENECKINDNGLVGYHEVIVGAGAFLFKGNFYNNTIVSNQANTTNTVCNNVHISVPGLYVFDNITMYNCVVSENTSTGGTTSESKVGYPVASFSYSGGYSEAPSNIRANVFASVVVDKDGNTVDNYNKYLTPGEYTARIAISIPKTEIDGVGDVQLYNSPVFIENIPIVITKQKSTGEFASLRKVTDITEGEGQSTANIQYKFSDKSGVDGYCVLKVNGETVVDNIASAETSEYSSYLFTTNTSGKFTATLEYIPAETDYIEFETTVLTQEFELEVLEPEIPIIPGGDNDGGITLPDLDLDTDGSHKFGFVNIIKNLVEALKAFIQQIGDFFSNLSLDSLGEVI